MKESYREGIANHPDPESCGESRSVDRGTGGQGIELRNQQSMAPTLFREAEGHTAMHATGECEAGRAQSQTPGTPGNSMRENRETPVVPAASGAGRLAKATSRTASVNAAGESDGDIVATKDPNQGGKPLAEGPERRSPAKGNAGEPSTRRTQGRASVSPGLARVREVARKERPRASTPTTQGKSRVR